MARRSPRRKTFAEFAAEPTWSETDAARRGAHAVRPGGVNAAGEFFDPSGKMLTRRLSDLSPAAAQRAVDAGAMVMAESCGCGGWYGGCTPVWLDGKRLRNLRGGSPPSFTGKHDAPTWLELWGNDDCDVVFAHGDVMWGDRALDESG